MGKVVTSQGLTEFVANGTVTHVPNHKPGATSEAAPALEVKKDAPVLEVKPIAEDKPKEPAAEPVKPVHEAEHEEALTEEEKALPEKAQKEIQRSKRAVNKKHAELMAAREELAEAERFGELQFNEKRLLEQRIEALEDAKRELEAKNAPTPKAEAKAPEMKDFTNEKGEVDWDKYTDAKAEFKSQQAVKAERERIAQEEASKVFTALRAKHQGLEDAARKAHADWDEVAETVKNTEADRAPPFVLNFIAESENSGELRYYLMTHPDEMTEIAKLSPIRGIKELGKIEDSLTVKPSQAAKETPAAQGATPKPGAPPPITPLSGSGNGIVNTDPAKMSVKELRAYERERERAKRERH